MLKHVNPPCPRPCGGLLVSYEDDDETPVTEGHLRCAGCGRYFGATDEMQAAARHADADRRTEQEEADRPRQNDTATLPLFR